MLLKSNANYTQMLVIVFINHLADGADPLILAFLETIWDLCKLALKALIFSLLLIPTGILKQELLMTKLEESALLLFQNKLKK
jgi:hypothetical protein